MQIKATLRFHFSPVRMAVIKKKNAGEDVEKNPYTLLAGM
jgi:hypothetical protein